MYHRKNCASSWLTTRIIRRCTVRKILNNFKYCFSFFALVVFLMAVSQFTPEARYFSVVCSLKNRLLTNHLFGFCVSPTSCQPAGVELGEGTDSRMYSALHTKDGEYVYLNILRKL